MGASALGEYASRAASEAACILMPRRIPMLSNVDKRK
jgi:hypothetical protein